MYVNKHRNRYEWRPVERKILFTYIKNIDTNTLLQIDDDDILIKTCLLNKYTQSLCNNYFWELKIRQLLPGFEFPIEYNNKGRELFLIISNVDLFFEREEIYNFESHYYQQYDYDDNVNIVYNDLNRDEISIANWSVKYSKPGLLKSMLKLGIHPDQNYINDAYDDYNIIKTLVDYINKNSDIDDIYASLPNSESILSLQYTELDNKQNLLNILKLLLPFNIVDIKEILINIFIFEDIESLQMIIDKKIYFTQDLTNLGFIYDKKPFPITKTLINNKLYPDDEIFDELPKRQKSYIQQFIPK